MENKHDVYRGKDCIKNLCESLKEHAMKIINLKKNKMKLLIKSNLLVLEKTLKNKNLYSFNRTKVKRIAKTGEKTTKKISYILRFIDSAIFMATSLSNIIINFSKIIFHKIKCK